MAEHERSEFFYICGYNIVSPFIVCSSLGDLQQKLGAPRTDAKPYLVAGDAYRNPWLGLELRKPAGFSFGRLDAVWPSTLLVEMNGPDGSRLELHEIPVDPWDTAGAAARDVLKKLGVEGEPKAGTAGGRDSYAASGADAAVVVIPEAGVVWAIKATGKAAMAGLDRAARSLRFRVD